MPSAQRTIVINRPIDMVFGFFTDPANDRKWRSAVKEIQSNGPPEVGSRIRQVITGPGGRGVPADIQIIAYEPSERYAFAVVAGPVRPRGEFRFRSTDADATEVTFQLVAEMGGLKNALMGKFVQRSVLGEVANLDRAKEVLEAG
jgi:uncharacterized membrane protein